MNHSLKKTDQAFVLPALAILAIVVIVISIPALQGPLVHDSLKLLQLETLLKEHPENPLINTPLFGDRLPGRIVAMWTFVANTVVSGDVSAYWMKATNVGLHIFCGILLFYLFRSLILLTSYREQAQILALLIISLWMLAPINLGVAFYAIQRMAQLSAIFTTIGLLAYVKLRQPACGYRKRLLLACTFAASLILATGSKENGLLLLPLAVLVEMTFFRFRGLKSWPLAARGWALVLAAIILVTGCILLFNSALFDYGHREFTATQRLLTQARVLWLYVANIIVPLGNDPGVIMPVRISTGLFSPRSTFLAVSTIALALMFIVWLYKRRYILPAFGLSFFFIAHSMESTIFPLEMAYLHRNYLASAGLLLALFTGSWELATGFRPLRPIVLLLLSALVLNFTATSALKSVAWSSEANFRQATYEHQPQSRRAVIDHASYLAESGRVDQAIDTLEPAMTRYFPDDFIAQIAVIYLQCLSDSAEIEQKDYASIGTAESWAPQIEISQALSNLLTVSRNNCPAIDTAELVEQLKTFSQRQAQARGDSWHVDFFIIQFLDSDEQYDTSNELLRDRLDRGEIRAGLYLAERLISQGRQAHAQEVLSRISQQFETAEIDPYRAAFRSLLERT